MTDASLYAPPKGISEFTSLFQPPEKSPPLQTPFQFLKINIHGFYSQNLLSSHHDLVFSPITALEYPQELLDKFYPDLINNADDASLARNSQSRAPALFVIGDSSVDCGTNNFLGTFARADRPPYGRDFDTHQPIGRFCNGRIPVDYIGTKDGQHISLTQQVQQFMDTFQQLILSKGEDAAYDLISNSIFYISIGSNDYIHYYLRNVSNVQSSFLPWGFNHFLAQTMKQEIEVINRHVFKDQVCYEIHGRFMVEDCYTFLYLFKGEFNFATRFMVEELNRQLGDASIIFWFYGYNKESQPLR
ncbi:hypothetical protein OROGR_005736 [Orobanche gracilis]